MSTPAAPTTVISHWYKLIEDFQASPMEFYAAVQQALQKRQIPELALSRVDWREGGMFAARREYLRVQRGKLAFDICGAPFGTGFFFSWWLAEMAPGYGLLYLILIVFGALVLLPILANLVGFIWGFILWLLVVPLILWAFGNAVRQGNVWSDDAVLAIPVIGWLYDRLFQPNTYYKIDTALMFQSAVHAAVLEVIDSGTSAKGMRALSELERKPLLREFYRR